MRSGSGGLWRRLAVAGLAAACALAAGGGAAWAEPWPISPRSGGAQVISELFWFTLVLAAVVFVLVEGLLIYSSLRFRRRGPPPAAEPPQIHGNTRLEVMWAIVPALILVGLFGITVSRLGALSRTPTTGLYVTATGQQFSWDFGYTDAGVHTTNDLHIPVGTPVIVDVTAKDVIHAFWVPELYGKIDAIPGRTNRISFQADQPGEFRGVCAELCGSGHAGMAFRVTALPQDDFNAWLQAVKSGAPPPGSGGGGAASPDQGKALIAQQPCGTCHVIPGVAGANGVVGPSLAGVASRTTIAGGAVPNTGPDDLKKWLLNPPAVKPGTAMPSYNLTDDQASAIVAYLETLK
jgi:cytochrome c oxidase subunit II